MTYEKTIFFYLTCFIPNPPSELNEQTNQKPVLPPITQVLKKLRSLLGQNMTEDI